MHHGCIVDKGQMLHVHAQIAPVGGQNVLTFLGQLQRVKHLFRAVSAGAEHVGIIRLQHLGVRVTLGGCDVGDAVQHLLEQVKERRHFLPGAGYILLHLVDEVFDSRGHRYIHGTAIGILGYDAETVLTLIPVQFYAVSVQNVANIAGVVLRTEVAQLVQRGLNLKASAYKASRRAAGHIVLFNQQSLPAGELTLQGRRQTGVASAYDHNIIFGHSSFLLRR